MKVSSVATISWAGAFPVDPDPPKYVTVCRASTSRLKTAEEYPILVPSVSKFPFASTQRSAVSVYGVLLWAKVEEPLITPVVVSRKSPEGSSGEIEYLFAPQPELEVEVLVIAFPALTVCVSPVEKLIDGSGESEKNPPAVTVIESGKINTSHCSS